MDNAELIKGLKDAERYIAYVAPSCYASNEALEAIRDAADLIKAQAKRIAELEAELPIVESVREDALMQRIAELEAQIPKDVNAMDDEMKTERNCADGERR